MAEMWGKVRPVVLAVAWGRLPCNQLWQRLWGKVKPVVRAVAWHRQIVVMVLFTILPGKYLLRRNGSIKTIFDDTRVDKQTFKQKEKKKERKKKEKKLHSFYDAGAAAADQNRKRSENNNNKKTEKKEKKWEGVGGGVGGGAGGGGEKEKSFTKISTHDCWCEKLMMMS